MVRKGVKWSALMCQGQPGSPCVSPGKMTIFPHLALFFHLSLQNIWHSHPLENCLLKSTRIELSLHNVLF